MSRGEVVWSPPADARSTTRMGAYLSWLESERGLSFESPQALWQWSIDELEAFWSSFAEWIGVRWSTPAFVGVGRADHAGGQLVPRRHAQLGGAGDGLLR